MTHDEPEELLTEAGMGTSPPFLEVVEQARELARISRPILIRGERGTGKELLARFIHASSPRRNKPYLIVNCGAFQEELFVSQLFGHEKGAFTSATERRIGLFERANGGTLFLDEVANLSLMLNMLPEIIAELVKTVDRITIDKVSVIDSGGGNGHGTGIGRFVSQFPAAVLSLSEQIETATGVNILSGLHKETSGSHGSPEGDPPVVAEMGDSPRSY